jgi:hypothetical protein
MRGVCDCLSHVLQVLNELADSYGTLLDHPTGSKVLLSVLAPSNASYFTSSELEVMQPPMRTAPDPADPTKTVQVPTSKKPAATRRAELLVDMLPALLAALLEEGVLEPLLRSQKGGGLVLEILREAHAWAHVSKDDKTLYDCMQLCLRCDG